MIFYAEQNACVESCFLVFQSPFGILQEWIAYFDHRFKSEKRWDDGWILRCVIEQTQHRSKDIGGDCDNPLQQSKYKNILVHNKGIHLSRRVHT